MKKIVPLMLIALVILLSAPIKIAGDKVMAQCIDEIGYCLSAIHKNTKLPGYCCGKLVKPQPCACKYFTQNPVLLPKVLRACRVPHPKC
ncbi:hypothetical protein CARUB_v10015295mg [Capsella rubella]|uniref:Bifunctional inhibitor/plant lipid transfer protein/seed storage helical domain-containing protein n=1 Tax=Capsella rubella TaxID=81985 RepID=R0I2D8_9BRAS|nr:hypothetical protein CARUB_v10015295mg [Capsella rubella]